MTTCKNCATEFEGKFCPSCGQKAKTKRITSKAVFEDVRRSLIHYDRGFFYTVLQLLWRPGHAVREYLQGKRVMHVKPIKFMLWATALNFLVFHLLRLDQDIIGAISEQQGKNMAGMKFTQYIFDHPALLLFLMIPNIAFFSWLYFRKQGFNYAEHFVLNAYLMGEVSMFGLVLNPLTKFIVVGHEMLYAKLWLQTFVWVGYMGWAYAQFFPSGKKWLSWLKSILALLSGYFMLLILITVLMALLFILFGPWIKPFFQG